jgi:hypothetical protein
MGNKNIYICKKMELGIGYKMASNNKRWEMVHWRLVTKSKNTFGRG